jgi:hypothetical protein
LKQNDPTLTKIDDNNVLPYYDYGLRLGKALSQNTKVTEMGLNLGGLLCLKDWKTFQTHSLTLLLRFITESPSLRKMRLATYYPLDTPYEPYMRMMLEAIIQNAGIVELDLEMLHLPVEVLTRFLEATTRIVSLKLNMYHILWEDGRPVGRPFRNVLDPTLTKVDSLLAALGQCTQLQHLVLSEFSMVSAQWIALVQAVQSRESSMLPIQS